jgi:hypothetical protein
MFSCPVWCDVMHFQINSRHYLIFIDIEGEWAERGGLEFSIQFIIQPFGTRVTPLKPLALSPPKTRLNWAELIWHWSIPLVSIPRYMKYLYPYECEKKRLSTPAELQAAIDGNRREGRRASYGPYPDMVSAFNVSTRSFLSVLSLLSSITNYSSYASKTPRPYFLIF